MPRPRERIPAEDAPITPVRVVTEPRRGLSREEAARYVGIGPTKFDEMVRDGRMPPPFRIDGRVIWDLRRLDLAIDALAEPAGRRYLDGADWAPRCTTTSRRT